MTTKRTKKTLIALSALCLFSLASCGGTSSNPASSPISSEATSSTAASQSVISSSEEKKDSSSSADPTPAPSGNKVSPVKSKTQKTALKNSNLDKKGKFYADYSSHAEQQQRGKELTVEIAEEGDVLLKNADNALPLGTSENRVTLFGMATVHLVEAGGGSGSGTLDNNGILHSTVQSSLEEAGFTVNPSTVSLYNKYEALNSVQNELPLSNYGDMVTSTYHAYNDAAVVTFDRIGSESIDCKTNNVDGHSDPKDHYLQLDDNEKALIKHVKKYFDKVIVLLNSANIMQIDDLAADKTDDNLGVDAILWVGTTGNNAIDAVGRIMNGEVCPSGHTVDLWSRDFTKDPTFKNFGNQTQNGVTGGAFFVDKSGNQTKYAEVEYRENIYNGYKYYETVDEEMNKHNKDGDAWYDSSVLYPFGYGLSYTSFEWEFAENYEENATLDAADKDITVQVKVTNTGNVAGKDVVQLYYSAPYTDGGIEKASINFVQFEKTDLLKPGESQILELSFVAQDMASFDWNDANGNEFSGYELEAGQYTISARRDSHTPLLETTLNIAEDIKIEKDYETGNTITPLYVDRFDSTNDTLLNNLLSRTDLVDAVQPDAALSVKISDAELARLDASDTYDISNDTENDPWYCQAVPTDWTQADAATRPENPELYFADMAGIEKDDPQWTTFLNQLTWEELCSQVRTGTGTVAIDYVGKGATSAYDGPVQVSGGVLFAGAPITAATYNKDLAYEMGRMVANDCIYNGITEWLGPACDIHRSPFGGRNFEYYSEDGVLSGLMVSRVVRGATDKGVVTMLKHFFANEQETYRDTNGGVCTFATEQALREIYGKPFEKAVKEGGSLGVMSSFNRIGFEITSGSYATMKSLLRKEWGFEGAAVGDAWTKDYGPLNMYVRGGTDQVLGSGEGYPKNDLTVGDFATVTPTQYYNVRTAAHNILYSRANSIANKNCYKNLMFDDIYVTRSAYSSKLLTINGSSDVTITDFGTLPDGLTIDGGCVKGTANVGLGVYTAEVNIQIDGWVEQTATVRIHVVSGIDINGTAIDENNSYNAALNQSFTMDISSSYFNYGQAIPEYNGFYSSDSINFWINNWYTNPNGGNATGQMTAEPTYSRNEDWTFAGCNVIDPDEDPENTVKHEFHYTAEGLPEGLELQDVYNTVTGANGSSTYEVATAAKIVGTPTVAGTYDVTITAHIPVCVHSASWYMSFWMGFSTGMVYAADVTYSETIHIVVA